MTGPVVASRHAQQMLAVLVVGTVLAGCATDTRPSDQDLALHGYWYHDGNYQDGGSGQANAQAIYSATHGTCLWPPAERPGR